MTHASSIHGRISNTERNPPGRNEPHIRRRQRPPQRDPSVTNSQIKNRRRYAAISRRGGSSSSSNCSKRGPESSAVGVWCRLVNISGVGGALGDREAHYDRWHRERSLRSSDELVRRTAWAICRAVASRPALWAAMHRDESIKLITARLTDGQTDGDSCSAGASPELTAPDNANANCSSS